MCQYFYTVNLILERSDVHRTYALQYRWARLDRSDLLSGLEPQLPKKSSYVLHKLSHTDVMPLQVKISVFLEEIPRNLVGIYESFGENFCFHLQDRIGYSESMVNISLHNIPEKNNFQSHCTEKLKSRKFVSKIHTVQLQEVPFALYLICFPRLQT